MIDFNIYNILYKGLEKEINEQINYLVNVEKYSEIQSDKFPLIVFSQTNQNPRNITTENSNAINNLYYEVNIYTINQIIDDELKSKVDISNELASIVDNFFMKHKLNCNFAGETPNIDVNVYRYTLRYNCLANTSRLTIL